MFITLTPQGDLGDPRTPQSESKFRRGRLFCRNRRRCCRKRPFEVFQTPHPAQHDAHAIHQIFERNLVILNCRKLEVILFYSPNIGNVEIADVDRELVQHQTRFGYYIYIYTKPNLT